MHQLPPETLEVMICIILGLKFLSLWSEQDRFGKGKAGGGGRGFYFLF